MIPPFTHLETGMADAAHIVRWKDIDWEQPGDAPDSVRALAEEGWKTGARRKYLTGGECGFHAQHSYMPPGFEVPPHSHNHDELFLVLEGSCRLNDGTVLTSYDAAVVPGQLEYGFVVGPVGMRFVVVRTAHAETSLSD